MANIPPWFAEYYRSGAISPQREWLELRWKGVEKFLASVIPGVDLVLLHYGLPLVNKHFGTDFRQAFYEHDNTFPVDRGQDHEVRILAACALTQALSSPSPLRAHDDLASMALCAQAQGIRKSAVPQCVERTQMYLDQRALALRSSPKSRQNDFFENISDSDDIAAVVPLFRDALASSERSSSEQIDILREEVNILWWIFGEHSRDLKKRFSDIPLPMACLVAGRELAQLCSQRPGPIAARALLDRVLRSAHPKLAPSDSLLADAVKDDTDQWLSTKHSAHRYMDNICPVHGAMSNGAGPKLQIKDPIDLAHQTYLEALLLKEIESPTKGSA